MDLPTLTDAEASLLHDMRALLAQAIAGAGGMLPFDQYMEMALYAPGLGYYVNSRRKFGEAGDFVTAPEVSPLFSQCLARQVAECLRNLDAGSVLEFGAGTGVMAADLLAELDVLDALPQRYLILELSPSLQQTQLETLRERVPQLLARVEWLQHMPGPGFQGVVLGNELLDAMPVQRFRRHAGAWQELSVGIGDDGLCDHWHDLHSPGLAETLAQIWPDAQGVEEGYCSEVNLRLAPWLQALASGVSRGYVILIDYGYTQREYYHPERRQGTLICHFRHRVHDDPYLLPGLQDITANVDFSAVARAGLQAGFALAGLTTQAHFLLDSGLENHLSASDPEQLRQHLQLMQGVKKLTLPSEMGERFKVLALARNAPAGLLGFRTRDLRDRL